MPATVTNMNSALKEFYLPRLRSTIPVDRILMTRLERDTESTDISGRYADVPVNLRPTQAIGARDDASNNSLPTAQNQTYVSTQVNFNYNYGTIRMTHPSIVASKNDKGSFIRVVGAEMDGIRRDLKNDINRQLFGDASGSLGTANGAGSSATSLVLDTGHKVKVNMVIDVYSAKSGGSQKLNSVSVTGVSGNTCTVASSSWADGDFVFREDNRGMEMMGLLGICDDASKTSGIGAFVTTLQAISRSTYPEWNAQVLEHSTPGTARAISSDLLDQIILEVQDQGEGDPSLMITTSTQWRKIGQLMAADRRYTSTLTLQGGFQALDWAGIPIVWDRDCPVDANGNDMLFCLDESDLGFYELQDWDFDDLDGDVLHRVSGQAAYDATLFYYAELGCMAPDDQGVIRDLER